MSSILSSNSWGGGWVAVASSERPVKNQPPYASALRSLGKTAALEIKQRFAIFHENFVQRQVVWKYLKFPRISGCRASPKPNLMSWNVCIYRSMECYESEYHHPLQEKKSRTLSLIGFGSSPSSESPVQFCCMLILLSSCKQIPSWKETASHWATYQDKWKHVPFQ